MFKLRTGSKSTVLTNRCKMINIKTFLNFCRCDQQNSCSVPVSSELFGDPCPGTHKYVEIHYTCSPR